MGLMVWAHKHSAIDKYKFRLPNVRHPATKQIYQILSWRLMGWAHRHNSFDKYKL